MRLLLNLHAVLTRLVVTDEAIRDVSKRIVDGLLVGEFGFVALRPSQLVLAPDSAALIKRLRGLQPDSPEGSRASSEGGESGTHRAKRAGESELREEIRLCH